MPRSKTVPDQKVLEATVQLVGSQGVDKLTFALLGEYTGLSPATLVQRYGTKQQLLAAVTRHCLESMSPMFADAKDISGSPLQSICTAFAAMSKAVTSVQEHANGQVFFYMALTDSATNDMLRSSMDESHSRIQALLDEAVKLNELDPCDTSGLALTLQNAYEGAITTWLVYQQGAIEDWVLSQLDRVIMPHRTTLKGE